MILIADECLNKNITKILTSKDYEIISISEVDLGISDKEVLIKSKNLNGILLTEDSDFGKWVFSHHFKGVTVIFLRYEKPDFEIILDFLIKTLEKLKNIEEKQFITINKNKIRYRNI